MELTKDNFDTFIAENKIAIIDFWAEWCGPCKMMKPVLSDLESEYNLTVGKIDADAQLELSQKFNIVSIPTLIVLENGIPVKTITGAMPKHKLVKELAGWI